MQRPQVAKLQHSLKCCIDIRRNVEEYAITNFRKVRHMKASELISLWASPDNTRLTAKQFSFRLPVHVAAKLAALCEIYPNKTRTEIVGDLLSTALEEVIEALPSRPGDVIAILPDGEKVHDEVGTIRKFRVLANRHYAELEKEMGNESSSKLYAVPDFF